MELKLTSSKGSVTITSKPQSDFYLTQVEGLSAPDIRTSKQEYSGRDGGRVNAQYYSQRLITITGYVNGANDIETKRIALQTVIPIREEIELIITTPAGNIYTTYGHILVAEMDYPNQRFAKFTIDFLCRDVYFLGETINTERVDIYSGGGGFILPVILPIVFGGGVGDETITNGGTEIVYPVISLYGTLSNPTINNVTTGQMFGFDINIYDGDKIVVDMYGRTATLNGSSIMSYRSDGSDWWGLQVNNNVIRLTTSDGDDDGYAEITWRNAILTI